MGLPCGVRDIEGYQAVRRGQRSTSLVFEEQVAISTTRTAHQFLIQLQSLMSDEWRGVGARFLPTGMECPNHVRDARLVLVKVGVEVDVGDAISVVETIQFLMDQVSRALPVVQRECAAHSRKTC